jgi:very-short-patch-repair endonuclease
VGYTDFYWKQAKVVAEFDGEEKYLKPEYLKGRTASQAVVEEKKRENRIRAAGFNIFRGATVIQVSTWNLRSARTDVNGRRRHPTRVPTSYF